MDKREDEQFGRVSFRLKQEAAVERALSKVRHHLGKDWVMMTSDDIDTLSWLFGEMWAHMSFMEWEKIGLDSITLESIDQLVGLSKSIKNSSLKAPEGLAKAREILGSL